VLRIAGTYFDRRGRLGVCLVSVVFYTRDSPHAITILKNKSLQFADVSGGLDAHCFAERVLYCRGEVQKAKTRASEETRLPM